MTTPRPSGRPLAVVGVACRFPGGITDLAGLWSALLAGRDVVTEVPPDRFDADHFTDPVHDKAGRSYTRAGGFLDDISGFDAEYFDIAPREASRIDPQQRLMLELAVESFEDAGISTGSLAGSETAVFVGAADEDYGDLQKSDPGGIDAYTLSGLALSNIANRVSYALDLRGPSMTIHTACSSSLVALHQAGQYLRGGDRRVALVGGVNILISPHLFVGHAKSSMLSPTGRCRAFSAHADGYVRSEGGGAIVLKPLADALADGDRVHAVVLGTGSNSDGRTAGLKQPSVRAQQALLTAVRAEAGVDAEQLVYFEAHGTGTPVGDPIECAAVGAAFGRHRSAENPLPVGTVKTNLGHTEAASGMAGLLKAVLVLRHRTIPASLHGNPVNPDIDFAELNLTPVPRATPTAAIARPVVGVNSFGFGGANAHALLGSAPAPAPAPREKPTPTRLPLIVSARSDAALRAAARRASRRLADSAPADLYDICWTARRRHDARPYRAVALGSTSAELADALSAIAVGEPAVGTAFGTPAKHGRVAFVFSGNGSQWVGMSADLLESDAVYRAAVEDVDGRLRDRLGWSVLDALRADAGHARMDRTEIAQPALFAVQVGLVAVLRHHGIVPDSVVGHSIGEIAAAHTAGALGLDDAVTVIAARSTAQGRTAGTGRMAAVGLGLAEVEAALAGFHGLLEVSAVNSPEDVTVSGDAESLATLGDKLSADGVFFRRLDLDHAFHSRTMDPIEGVLRDGLGRIRARRTAVTMVSTVTGAVVCGEELDSDYWWRNVREPVRFEAAARRLLQLGCDVLVEVGPQPVLGTYLRRIASGAAAVIPTLKRSRPGTDAVADAVAAVMATASQLDWRSHFPVPGRVVDLPAYPWQRERHWHGDPELWIRGAVGKSDHPLLGERAPVLEPTWHGVLTSGRVPWLADHGVGGAVVVPATAFVEMGVAAGRRALAGAVEIVDLAITHPLVLREEEPQVQVSLSDEDGALRIASRLGTSPWRQHAHGRVRRLRRDAPPPLDLDVVRARLGEHVDGAAHYERSARIGYHYGPFFQVVRELWLGVDEVLGRYECDADPTYEVHPALLDGALQAGLPLLGGAALPVSVDAAWVWRSPAAAGFSHVTVRARTATQLTVDVVVTDDSGAVAVELRGCRMRHFDTARADPVDRHGHVLRAAPRFNDSESSPLPPPAETAAAVRLPTADHTGLLTRLHELSARFAAHALSSLAGSEPFTSEDLVGGGVLEKYRRLLAAMLTLTAAHGLAERVDGTRWRIATPAEPEELFRELLGSEPGRLSELVLLGRCGRNLTDVLSGHRDPLDLLFGGDMATVDHFYDGAVGVQDNNLLARAALAAIVRRWPADRPLRILEVGAGTGGTTAAVLPVLPPERTRYAFTDVSPTFLARAAVRFADHDVLEYRVLDLDGDLPEEESMFDLVIAANVVHATTDVQTTLHRIGRLLADGGQLLLIELTDPHFSLLTFGLLDGWWSSTDNRSATPLLSADRWHQALLDAGFSEVTRIGDGFFAQFLATAHRDRIAEPRVAEPVEAAWAVAAESPAERRQELAAELARELRAPVVPWPDVGRARGVVVLLDGEGTEDLVVRRLAALGAVPRSCRQLWLVTRPPDSAPADASAWGASRCLAEERPDLDIRRISLERGDPATDAKRLARELLAPADEDEIVLTRSGRFVPRMAPLTVPRRQVDLTAEPHRLELRDRGPSYTLAWVRDTWLTPGPGQVAIAVRAVGLNYRDVLWAVGNLPEDAAEGSVAGRTLGMDCAGVVTAVGDGVTTVQPGHRVAALAAHAFASSALADARLVLPLPDHRRFADAATIPTAFLTARYGLDRLARLAPGETVLVHSGAGGVGLAAIQHARAVGAQVIATAGTDEKRDLLRLLGVRHVLGSRDLTFADEVMEITHGRGVDVVLNSLAGEALSRSLGLLRPGGRFVEIGKRDLYADSPLRMRPMRANISFFVLDLDRLCVEATDLVAEELRTIDTWLEAGRYQPLAHRVYPAARVADVFRLMQHSRHLGKLVVSLGDEPVLAEIPTVTPTLDASGTYLVTGGLSGLGAASAAWLADRGARTIALVSRRGDRAPEAPDILAALRNRGVTATAYAADAADLAAMTAVVAAVDATGRPLRGAIHAAMVLDDGPLAELTEDRLRASIAPKIRGALVLDELTRDRDTDLFVLFSSVMTVLGNANQANYAAGNLFLEALARQRVRAGLPATAVGFGVIGDTGFVARNGWVGALAARGIPPITAREAFAGLNDLLAWGVTVGTVARYDWDALRTAFAHVDSPRLSGVVPPPAETIEDAEPGDAASMEDAVARLVADVLGTTHDRLDRNRPLDQLGVDSLMSNELRAALQRRFGRDIPILRLLGGGIGELARSLLT